MRVHKTKLVSLLDNLPGKLSRLIVMGRLWHYDFFGELKRDLLEFSLSVGQIEAERSLLLAESRSEVGRQTENPLSGSLSFDRKHASRMF